MEVDLYHPCPCQPEKKIKFCCAKEVANGLSEVLTKHESRQTMAALESLKRLIDEQGPQDCLLLTRSQLELALGKMEDALVTARQFVEKNPKDSLGLERLATALAYNRQPEAAYEALQDAMDNLPDNSVPIAFASSTTAARRLS